MPAELQFSQRTLRDVITDLETMGLVETWIESRGREGRVKQLETTFDPAWVRACMETYIADSTYFEGVTERTAE